MNKNFNPVVVRDSVIQDIGNQIPVAMYKGASSTTYQKYKAGTQSKSNLNWNINIPSENTIIDRNIKVGCKLKFVINITGVAENYGLVFKYGESEALQAFPLNSLITNASLTVNNAQMNVNTQDIMGALLKLCDDDEFQDVDAPTLTDRRYLNYAEMIQADSNPLKSYRTSAVGSYIGRGAHPVKISVSKNGGAVVELGPNNTQQFTDASTPTAGGGDNQTFKFIVDVEVIEPLLFLSPLLYGKNNMNKAGMYGVNNLQLSLNLDTTAKRSFSMGKNHANATIELSDATDAYIYFRFLSPQISDMIVPKNVLPYTQYERNITTFTSGIAVNDNPTFTSNSIQFSSIPERFIIFVRKQIQEMTMKDATAFLPIENISITFNNISGLLSGASQYDLFEMSKRNGVKLEWYEFKGSASSEAGVAVPSIGSVLVINPSLDLNLPEFLSNSSLGQFNLQFNISVKNTYGVVLTPELVVISEYNGLFTTEGGFSNIERSLLSKDVVISTTQAQHGLSLDYVKKFSDGLISSNSSNMLKNIPELNKKVSGGGVMSGGGMSKGVMSGGVNYV